MISVRSLALLGAFATLACAGCAFAQDNVAYTEDTFAPQEIASQISSDPPPLLPTTHWTLIQLNGKPPVKRMALTLAKVIFGLNTCGEIFATYDQGSEGFQIKPVESNAGTCNADEIEQQQAVISALKATRNFRIQEEILELTDGAKVLAKFSRKGILIDDGGPEPPVSMFPWPPPMASAKQVIPNGMLRRGSTAGRYGEINQILIHALEQKGYYERSYFGAPPGGFVLVTRLEHIEPDGSSMGEPGRWSVGSALLVKQFSLEDYIRALFTADPGYYRIIAFVVSDTPFRESEKKPTESEANAWLSAGDNVLPVPIAQAQFTASMNCTVLIYEFQRPNKTDSSTTKFLSPSPLDAHTHLIKSGLWAALGRELKRISRF